MVPVLKLRKSLLGCFQENAGNVVLMEILLLLCITELAAYLPSEYELPDDETEAQVFIKDGLLDSTLWLELQPFYRQPLDVPAGELSLLGEVFPDLIGNVPIEQSELERYLPWDDRAINRFFQDYPVMTRFKPILRFEHHQTRRSGNIAFSMNRSGYDTLARHAARCNLSPTKNVSFQGTIDFTSDYARWDRRGCAVNPFTWLSVKAGNIPLFSEQGLVYGYFPSTDNSQNDLTANWLYGGKPNWNGVALTCSGTGKDKGLKPELTCFFHERPTERITGCNLAITRRKVLTVSLGATRCSLYSLNVAPMYVHGSMKVQYPIFASELYCALENKHEVSIPFSWKNSFRYGKRTVEISLIRLPALFSAPRSNLLRRFSNEMDGYDTLLNSISLVRMSTERKNDLPIRLNPKMELWFSGANIDHGTFQLRGEGTWQCVESSILFSQEFRKALHDDHRSIIEGVLDWKVLPSVTARTMHRYCLTRPAVFRYRGSITPSITLRSYCLVEPCVTFMVNSGGSTSILAGCREKTALFDRAFTEFTFEKDCRAPLSGSMLRVEGRASFFF